MKFKELEGKTIIKCTNIEDDRDCYIETNDGFYWLYERQGLVIESISKEAYEYSIRRVIARSYDEE